ncbi:hypothetical protein CDIK_0716 [Cucumispora dikerogammari]|nr:hypothetical protein CDIK_0716 [Cucumispora dikerogammari]
MYWRKSCYGQPLVSSNISRQRFDFIKSNFSIYDVKRDGKLNESTLADKYILYLNSLFQSAYSSFRNLSIAEEVCPWKGKLRFKTYNPMEPNKYGIIVYLNYESKTGYLLKFQICAGSKPINETVMVLMDKYTEKKTIYYIWIIITTPLS